MTKLARLDADHFALLVDDPLVSNEVDVVNHVFESYWPGKKLLIFVADDLIDLTGQYELVPVPPEIAGVEQR